MADSPAHRFGQIIGEVLEAGTLPLLEKFADKHDLYLDKKGERPARKGVKCSWFDAQKNKHDLDFVLEKGGSLEKRGLPVAFVEVAWRRYTKHSKNKAQEIQGAILPLVETYQKVAPFAGAILAGEFTSTALTQLRSLGVSVVYISYETVVQMFTEFGVDAAFDEKTPDASFAKKVAAFERLSAKKRDSLARSIIDATGDQWKVFMQTLEQAVSRQIETIVVLPLHGSVKEVSTVDDAIDFINGYDEQGTAKPVDRYEIQIRYNNGNRIDGKFNDKNSAVAFLLEYVPALINAD